MTVSVITTNVGRPPLASTKVTRAVLALAAEGSPFQAPMLAAAILVVADQNTVEERVDRTAHEDNGVGFSKRTAKAGLSTARWVRGGAEKRVSFTGDTFTYDAEKYTLSTISEPNEHGVREALLVAVGHPITPGYHTKRAHDVVVFHSKQIGRLEVAGGNLQAAMAEIEAKHGVTGLRQAFVQVMVAQEREKVEAAPKPAKVKSAKPVHTVTVAGIAVAQQPLFQPAPALTPVRWAACS